MKPVLLFMGGLAVLIVATGLTGCTDGGKKARKTKTQNGIAKKIDLKNNSVSMTVVGPDGKEGVLEGSVKEDTEVIINGRASKLEDVHEGDNVSVSGYRDGKDEDRHFVATRVEVKRAADKDWKSTNAGSKPASAPPAKP